MPQPDLGALLELAVEAATAAGTVLMQGVGQARRTVETKSSSTDMVTEMDRAAERVVVEALRRHRPNDAILAEEGADTSGTSNVRWVVDPLDGTTNYLYGRPEFAVSVAAEVDGRPAVGVVHDPSRAETFTAVAGIGSWLNDGPLHLPRPPALAQALVGTGFNYDSDWRAEQARALVRILPLVRDIRRLGAAALDLCWVAAGRLDAFWEAGLHHWDWAGGALVAAEAGAWVGDLHGGPPSRSMTMAGPVQLVEALRLLLAEEPCAG